VQLNFHKKKERESREILQNHMNSVSESRKGTFFPPSDYIASEQSQTVTISCRFGDEDPDVIYTKTLHRGGLYFLKV